MKRNLKSIFCMVLIGMLLITLPVGAAAPASESGQMENCWFQKKAKVLEMKKYAERQGGKQATLLARKIRKMRQTDKRGYRLYYKGNKMEVGVKKGERLQEFVPYDQITDIKNLGNKEVAFYGIKIGDSYHNVEVKLKKAGFFLPNETKNVFYQGNAAQLRTIFKNGKLSSYIWKLRYTG